MRLLGFEITRTKQNLVPALAPVYGGFFGRILEPFAGAWQRNLEALPQQDLLAFSAVYACVSLIAGDIAKLRIKLTAQQPSGIWTEISNPAFSPVLRKPNRYQTRIQFLLQWLVSKLLQGNAYILLERDNRKIVIAMYVLDPRRVTPLVASDGGVFYQIQQDYLSGVEGSITVPGSEIIHDRCIAPYHPLIGVSPIFACGISATQGIKIQENSSKFFANMSRPSGQLTAPGTIQDITAERIKREFESGFSGANIGKLFVGGDGLKFEGFTIPAADSQLIEQLKWTVEDVSRTFEVPIYKLGGAPPKFSNAAQMDDDYYKQCLQIHIESIELLLDEALGLPPLNYGTELDLNGLLRMDPAQRAETNAKAITAGYMAPNEARASENLPPVDGGETPYMQKQNVPLAQLSLQPPETNPTPPVIPDSGPSAEAKEYSELMHRIRKGIQALEWN